MLRPAAAPRAAHQAAMDLVANLKRATVVPKATKWVKNGAVLKAVNHPDQAATVAQREASLRDRDRDLTVANRPDQAATVALPVALLPDQAITVAPRQDHLDLTMAPHRDRPVPPVPLPPAPLEHPPAALTREM